MRVAALDLSSKTGWAVWDGSAPRPILGTKQLVGWGYEIGSTLEFWRLWLGDFVTGHKPEFVAIEAPFIPDHGDGSTIMRQCALFGFTCWALKQCGIRVEQVHSATWRKHFLGSGRGKTDDLKEEAKARCRALGWTFPDHNAAEAGGILCWAIHQRLSLVAPWRDQLLLGGITAGATA